MNYFSFEVLKTKIWASFQRIIELFTKNIVKKLLKIWSWDPGSGKTYSGSRIQGSKKAPDPGSATLHNWIAGPSRRERVGRWRPGLGEGRAGGMGLTAVLGDGRIFSCRSNRSGGVEGRCGGITGSLVLVLAVYRALWGGGEASIYV